MVVVDDKVVDVPVVIGVVVCGLDVVVVASGPLVVLVCGVCRVVILSGNSSSPLSFSMSSSGSKAHPLALPTFCVPECDLTGAFVAKQVVVRVRATMSRTIVRALESTGRSILDGALVLATCCWLFNSRNLCKVILVEGA